MSLEQIKQFLLPVEPERDPGFRAEVERLGRRGLRVIGWVEIVMPFLSAAITHTATPVAYSTGYPRLLIALSVLLGIGTMSCARTPWGSRFSREIGIISGVASVWIGLHHQIHFIDTGIAKLLSGSMTILVVILVGLAVLPLRPIHGFVMGLLSGCVYYAVVEMALRRGSLRPEHIIAEEQLGVPLVVMLYTALTAVSYERLAASWRSRVEALEAAEELRRSESRTLIAENAAGMNRLAAAVSHELNSPLGAMKSAADTLPLAVRRLAGADASRREQFAEMAGTLASTVSESASRMQEIVGRMQRFTNLDRAEVMQVDVRQLIADVVAFVTAESDGRPEIESDVAELPKVRCRPQQLSAVLASLLHLSVERAGSDGSVWLAGACNGRNVEVSISDSGPKLSPREVTRLFDPEFRVSENRVTTGDWNLFAARRLANEAGGDIRSDGGNSFVITLPDLPEKV